jgi:polysaccharide export outer membrane protein
MRVRTILQAGLLSLLVVLGLSRLALAQTPAPPQQLESVPPAPTAEAPLSAVPASYVLGPNDRVRLIVFGEENLSGEFLVDASGKVALPLIGELTAAGLDVRAFERAVQARLADGYLRDPRVSVEILTARPFFVLGEVANPGQYPFVSGMTAANAIAIAGGFNPLADQTKVRIKRSGSAVEETLALTPTTTIAPGDTLQVVKGAFFILGEVNAPGEYSFTPGMTVLQAIATARGFTYRANRSKVYIQHAGDLVEERLKVSPSLTIQPGDTIRVGERFF